MYGVPSDLPLADFVGHTCTQIALGCFQIQFHFGNASSISVESRWQLQSAAGDIIDAACAHRDRECYRVHRLLGVAITRFEIRPPHSFTLFFETGDALAVFDDSNESESFSVSMNTTDLHIRGMEQHTHTDRTRFV